MPEEIQFNQKTPINNSMLLSTLVLLLAFVVQLSWHHFSANRQLNREYLPPPPAFQIANVFAMGEPAVMSRAMMLWLQAFDNQPGIDLPLRELNYKQVLAWLDVICKLDELSQYPLFSAAYIYANVSDQERQRLVFNFIEKRFMLSPNLSWRWLAHSAIQARHSLKDNDLALYYANLLRVYTSDKKVPVWARQMEIGILEEKGEYESARLLIGGLLSETPEMDHHELYYLNQRLKELKAFSSEK